MDECVFCKIVRRELPAEVVYDGTTVMAFRDAAPQAPVHLVVVPKTHLSSIIEAETSPLVQSLMEAAVRLAKARGLNASGYRIVVNTGDAAGQTVKHLHVHLLGGRPLGNIAAQESDQVPEQD